MHTPAATPPATAETTCTVRGLARTTAYVFTVVANNAAGPSAASVASLSATPLAGSATPVPLFDEWWEKLLLSMMLMMAVALSLRGHCGSKR